MSRFLSTLALCFFSSSLFAATAELGMFFPAHCPGSAKAARAWAPQADFDGGFLKLSFNLSLLKCEAGHPYFMPYTSQPEEYVEVYEIRNVNTVVAHAPIGDVVQVRLPVSKLVPVIENGVQTFRFRADVFLFGQHIPFRLTVFPDGFVQISK